MNPLRDLQVRRLDQPRAFKALKIALWLAAVFAAWIAVMSYLAHRNELEAQFRAQLDAQGIHYRIFLDRGSYSTGEPVHLRLSIQNASTAPVAIQLPAAEKYRFTVKREYDFLFFRWPFPVWNSPYESVSSSPGSALVLKQGEEKVFDEIWDQKDSAGRQVRPGRIIVSVWLSTPGAGTVLELPVSTRR